MSDSTQGTHAGAQPAVPPRTDDSGADEAPKTFTQAELDQIIDQRLKRQRQAFEAQQREAQAALETQKLEDQKEFEQLARQRAEEIQKLKPRAELSQTYEQRVQKVMDIAIQHTPSETQFILAKLSLPDQLDWLEQHLTSLSRPPVTTSSTDINAYTRQQGASQSLTDEEYLRKKRQEGIYK